MANHASAKKKIRQIAKRTAINRNRLSRVKTYVKKVETAILAGDKAAATAALRLAEPELMTGAQKGVLHKNTAARKVSRLVAQIKGL